VIAVQELDSVEVALAHNLAVDHDGGSPSLGLALPQELGDGRLAGVAIGLAVEYKIHGGHLQR
jgi:hypothetical protein